MTDYATTEWVNGVVATAISGIVADTQGPQGASGPGSSIDAGATAAGDIVFAEVAAPASPSSGNIAVYASSANGVLSAKTPAGIVSNTVVPGTASAGEFVTGVTATGALEYGTPGGGGGGSPGGSSAQIQYNNNGSLGGFTASGDATINTSTGAVTVTKSNGVAFAASATTDTTNAANISSGVLPVARLPIFGSSTAGAVPASGGGTTNFQRADGSWAVPPGAGGTFLQPQTGAVSRTMQSKNTDIVSVLDFIQPGTTTDYTTTIQAAIDAFDPNTSSAPSREIRLPPLDSGAAYVISGSGINLPSGVYLVGEGIATVIDGSAMTSGAMITMIDTASNGTCNNAGIRNLLMKTSATNAVWAITQKSGLFSVNCDFMGIVFSGRYCLNLGNYAQSCRIDIVGTEATDQLLCLAGNRNTIYNADVEGTTGTSTDPLILVQQGGSSLPSNSNVFHSVLLEGSGSTNKVPFVINGAYQLGLHDYWMELGAISSVGALQIENAQYVHWSGAMELNAQGISISSGSNVEIDYFYASEGDVQLFPALVSIDSTSQLTINNLITRRYNGINAMSQPNISVGKVINTAAVSASSTYAVFANDIQLFGPNMLVNGSFNSGMYGWTDSGGVGGTYTRIAAPTNSGGALQVSYGSALQSVIYQNVTINADQVGLPFTFCGYLNAVAGSDWVCLVMNGCGAPDPFNSGLHLEGVYGPTSGWQFVSRTFVPSSAGTLSLGVQNVLCSEFQVADLSFRCGQKSVPNFERNVGAATTAAPASPTASNSTSDFVMQGLAFAFTPLNTGNVLIVFNAYASISVTTAGQGVSCQISYGTGSAPNINTALAGTQVGPVINARNPGTAGAAADFEMPISMATVVTGLTPGTAYWFDIAAKAIGTAGDCNLVNAAFSIIEVS